MHNPIALQHYGSWQQLLDKIDEKVAFYTRLAPIFQLMKDGGLHPEKLLDPTHPAYFSDAIALRCLTSYDPQETDPCAFERCMTVQLHLSFALMEKADRTRVKQEGKCWEQYPLDSLQRLIWRMRESDAEIDFFLNKTAEGRLEDRFRLTLKDGNAVLTTCAGNRCYEIPARQTQEAFCQKLNDCFKLATEERGYFVPVYVWLSKN